MKEENHLIVDIYCKELEKMFGDYIDIETIADYFIKKNVKNTKEITQFSEENLKVKKIIINFFRIIDPLK